MNNYFNALGLRKGFDAGLSRIESIDIPITVRAL